MKENMGLYEILSHVSMPECSIRIIRMLETEHVAPHYHEKCSQIYTVLEHAVEARVGDHTLLLRPYETVRIEKNTVHSIRTVSVISRDCATSTSASETGSATTDGISTPLASTTVSLVTHDVARRWTCPPFVDIGPRAHCC